MPGDFQIRGTTIPEAVLAACRGELELTKPGNMNNLAGCSEIAALIKEEQLLNGQKQVSEPLKQLINFIIEVIECDVKKSLKHQIPQLLKTLNGFQQGPLLGNGYCMK